MCLYECNADLTPFEFNHKCLNNLDLFFDSIGGVSIFIIIILAAFFAIAAIIYFVIARNKNENLEEDENLNRLRL